MGGGEVGLLKGSWDFRKKDVSYPLNSKPETPTPIGDF